MIGDRPKRKRVFIDTAQAIKDGVNSNVILFQVEKYFNSKYWQNRDNWRPVYKYLAVLPPTTRGGESSIKGKMILTELDHKFYDIEVIDWWDINHYLEYSKDNCLQKSLDKTKFNENLL